MAQNAREIDDHCRPWPSEKDRDDYEAWHEYVLWCQSQEQPAGLTSQNVDPAQLLVTAPLARTTFRAEEDCSPSLSPQRQQLCSPAASDQTSQPAADQASEQ